MLDIFQLMTSGFFGRWPWGDATLLHSARNLVYNHLICEQFQELDERSYCFSCSFAFLYELSQIEINKFFCCLRKNFRQFQSLSITFSTVRKISSYLGQGGKELKPLITSGGTHVPYNTEQFFLYLRRASTEQSLKITFHPDSSTLLVWIEYFSHSFSAPEIPFLHKSEWFEERKTFKWISLCCITFYEACTYKIYVKHTQFSTAHIKHSSVSVSFESDSFKS